uniref:Uncharacterized protein n=1 Tax=Cryptomonas curvata TaxID=233186 RepID=A0A7S0N498_9CRYP
MGVVVECIEKLDIIRQALKKASEAFAAEPDSEVLRCEVVRLQADFSCLSTERDHKIQCFDDLSSKHTKARLDFIEEKAHMDLQREKELSETRPDVQYDYGMSRVYRYMASCFLPHAVELDKKLM